MKTGLLVEEDSKLVGKMLRSQVGGLSREREDRRKSAALLSELLSLFHRRFTYTTNINKIQFLLYFPNIGSNSQSNFTNSQISPHELESTKLINTHLLTE